MTMERKTAMKKMIMTAGFVRMLFTWAEVCENQVIV